MRRRFRSSPTSFLYQCRIFRFLVKLSRIEFLLMRKIFLMHLLSILDLLLLVLELSVHLLVLPLVKSLVLSEINIKTLMIILSIILSFISWKIRRTLRIHFMQRISTISWFAHLEMTHIQLSISLRLISLVKRISIGLTDTLTSFVFRMHKLGCLEVETSLLFFLILWICFLSLLLLDFWMVCVDWFRTDCVVFFVFNWRVYIQVCWGNYEFL